MLVILERDKREENDEYQEEGSDHQDDREKTQAYELEVIVTIPSVYISGVSVCTICIALPLHISFAIVYLYV